MRKALGQLPACNSAGSMNAHDMPPIVVLWILRTLVELGGDRELVGPDGFRSNALARAIGLGHRVAEESATWNDLGDLGISCDIDGFAGGATRQKVLAELRRLHVRAERGSAKALVPAIPASNIECLSNLVGLSEVDARLLAFAAFCQCETVLHDALGWIGTMSQRRTYRALSIILGVQEVHIRDALSPRGVLARSGLLTMSRRWDDELPDMFGLLSEQFGEQLICTDAEPALLIHDSVRPAPAPELQVADYPHLEQALSILRPYVKKALASGRTGVNLLLHGEPGTGKTQLARILAADAGCELFEVSGEDANGDAMHGVLRLRAYRAAQCFFAARKSMIVFDEAEDLFAGEEGFFGARSIAQKRKGLVNCMLEENPVPAVWISNSIGAMDPAFIRRFDLVVEVPVPPRRQRERVLRAECADLLDENGIRRLSTVERLAPAVVARAANVVRIVGNDLPAAAAAAALEAIIANTLEAQGHSVAWRNVPTRLPETYDPSFIRADADLVSLAEGLGRTGYGRLCLYGPPGTGKTAYARWLSEQLDRPLLLRKASDLLGMYVGENERNIADAFRTAERDRAILLIDEIDSFLQDRRKAGPAWEVSMVNELLTGMEAFGGIFIASTNLMQGLDQAALRRFDCKVRFDYLDWQQIVALLDRTCAALVLAPADAIERRIVSRLCNLTPGDFAAVSRRHQFQPLRSAGAFIEALSAECALKEGARAAIGFL